MKPFAFRRQFISRRAYFLAACGILSAWFSSAGCTDRACLDWPEDRGACPSSDEALKRFGGQSCVAPIKDVLSEAEKDGTVCCYEVEKRSANDRTCGPASSTTSGTPIPTTPCTGCAKFMSGESSELCAESVNLFNSLVSCVCSGPCAVACDDGSCATSFDTPECQSCVNDNENGCGVPFNACMNN